MSETIYWGKLRWPEIAELAKREPRMVIWPLGTTEQHGRHLPTDVDMRNCWEVAEAVSARTGVPLLPGLPYGHSGFWTGWPGTLSLKPETLRDILCQVAAGVAEAGFERLLLLNGHIGNGPALTLSEADIRENVPGLQVRALSWWDVSPRVIDAMYDDALESNLRSFHANDGETSVYLVHSPDRVRMEEAVDEPKDYERPLYSYHSRKVTRTGVIGRPLAANVEKGKKILEMAVEDLSELIMEQGGEALPGDAWELPKRYQA